MQPIIKYSGGKRREYKYFKKYIPNQFRNYYEPFLGGGATFFALEPKRAYLSDINQNLIHFYLDLQKHSKAVMKEINHLHSYYARNVNANKKQYHKYHYVHHDKNQILYYRIRKMFNHLIPSEFHYATLYYFLNKTAYAGMVRYNRKHLFNVPFGRYMNFTLPARSQIKLLQHHCKLSCVSYQKPFRTAQKEDFMFLDPPYDTHFSSYGNGSAFTGKEQIELAHHFYHLKCRALMVVKSTPLINKLYQGYIRDSYGKYYTINIKNRFTNQKKARHLIITNY